MGHKQENRASHDDYADAKAYLKQSLAAGMQLSTMSDEEIGLLAAQAINRDAAFSKSTVRQLRESLGILRPPKPKSDKTLEERVTAREQRFADLDRLATDLRAPALELKIDRLVPTGSGPHPPAGTSAPT